MPVEQIPTVGVLGRHRRPIHAGLRPPQILSRTQLTYSEREQAQEGQYIRDLEKEKLRKLKEKADAANKEVEAQKARMAQNGDKDH